MARAQTLTKLSIDRWFALVGVNPLHGNGVYIQGHQLCGQPWLQWPWQAADRTSREDLAQAIALAEGNIEQYLGYRLMPTFEVDEWQPTIRPYRPEAANLAGDVRGYSPVVELNWGHTLTGGIRSSELIQADAPVVYTDLDADGYAETATVTATVPDGIPTCDIRLFYPGIDGGQSWEIRPITVIDNGNGTYDITCARHQLVAWEKLDDLTPGNDSQIRGVDGLENDNFETVVDVYRVYLDPQRQAIMLWEPTGCLPCGGGGCEMCSFSAQTACLMSRGDPRLGLVSYRPATWNATTLAFDSASWPVGRQPDAIRTWYYAGWRDKRLPCPMTQMAPEWERVVAYYAAALLDRPVCGCENSSILDHWREDLAKSNEQFTKYNVPRRVLENPFGTRRGEVAAWQAVRAPGVALTR